MLSVKYSAWSPNNDVFTRGNHPSRSQRPIQQHWSFASKMYSVTHAGEFGVVLSGCPAFLGLAEGPSVYDSIGLGLLLKPLV